MECRAIVIARAFLNLVGDAILRRLAALRSVQRVAGDIIRASNKRHLAALDRDVAARSQLRILLGLVHHAEKTQFGREHDFRRIRTLDDFRRLVPVRDWMSLWREYWQPVFPRLTNVTWPNAGGYLLDPTAEHFRPVALSPALLAARRQALRTAMAVAGTCLPNDFQPTGRILLVQKDNALAHPSGKGPPEDLHGLAAGNFPWILRPFGDARVDFSADEVAQWPIRGLVGPAARLLTLIEEVKQAAFVDAVHKVWPGLSVVLASVEPGDTSVTKLRAELGDDVLLLQTHFRPEGPVAVQDPQTGLLRCLTDHGVFHEFVPVAEIHRSAPPRFGVADVPLGVPCELVLTSPAGLWACRVGLTVCFEQRHPLPLFRLVATDAVCEAPTSGPVGARSDAAAFTSPAQAPHRRSAGIPAEREESFARNLSSTLAGRG